ncbi:MAG: ABC transporter substrate-binding protein [Bacteroidales bacterium]|nr:ABC transporter substrate-binding protein [Bacteroidales bacterium]
MRHEVSDTVTDDYGRTVVINGHASRIVSASPSITEILYAMGQSHRLVGRTDFCLYPPEADTLPSIGGISNLNIEAILALHPDLVLTASMIPQRSVDQLEQMGVPVVCIIEKNHFEDLYGNIRQIGGLIHCEAAADSLITLLQQRVKDEFRISNFEKDSNAKFKIQNSKLTPTVYYVVGFGPTGNFTAGGNTFIDDIIRLAGGRNLAHDVTGWSYSLESLIQNDPDYIVVRREDSAAFCHTQPYTQLTAVKQGRVIGIESGTMDLQVPRNIDAVLYLRSRIKKP